MSDFLYNVPRSYLLHIVRKADAKKGYDDTEARVSVLLDVDRGQVKSQRDYARIWGQSRKWVRYRWEEIVADVVDLCTSHGRQLDGPLAQKLPPEWLEGARREHGAQSGAHEGPIKGPAGAQKTPETERKPKNGAHIGAHQGPSKGPHTKHPTSHPHPSPPETRGRGSEKHPAVAAYRSATGHGIAADQWAAKIIRAVGEDPADVEAWSEQCLVWANTGRWNEQNVPKMLRAFEEEKAERNRERDEQPSQNRPSARGQRERRRAAEQDPAGSYERISQAVDDALGI